ncbi:hypothetical protein J6590_005134 [Homalodisca vitripennis]|nr:hypothetical protein J6590_005134 [Homalodisca vitripennis]
MDSLDLTDLSDFDAALDISLSSQTDHWYPVVVCLMSLHVVANARVDPLKTVYRLNNLVTCFFIIQAVLLKYMVSKRINVITEKITENHEILEFMLKTRKILGYNLKVNDNFSLRVANAFPSGMLPFLHSLSIYWRTYGINKGVTKYMEYRYPVLAILLRSQIVTELLFLAGTSSRISNHVESLSWEIDRRASTGENSIEYRKKLEVFMLELAHTPVLMTGADLFTYDNGLITDVSTCH